MGENICVKKRRKRGRGGEVESKRKMGKDKQGKVGREAGKRRRR